MNRAIAYAEDTVGVHRTWLYTQELQVQLNDLYQEQSGYLTETRNLDWQIDRRKNQILIEESEANASMAVTAFERHIKLVIAKDDELASLYEVRCQAMSRRDAVEATIKSVERNSNGHIARLKELGGYFEFLAVTKAAQMQAVTAAQAASESPW
jgi:hypothetical protein